MVDMQEREAIPLLPDVTVVPRYGLEETRDGDVKKKNSIQPEDHKISNRDAVIHLLKCNLGTGILAMPDGIKNSGLVVGNIGLVVMAAISVHCWHVLVSTSQELSRRTNRSSLSYSDVAEICFATSSSSRLRALASIAKTVIDVLLCITQLGFCCVYFVFISQNLQQIVGHYYGEIDYKVFMTIILIPMLLLANIRNLKNLSPVSLLANILQLLCVVIIFYYVFQDVPNPSERKLFATWIQLPLYFGTAMFAFTGISVVLPVENQMKTPSGMNGWNGVLNTAMFIEMSVYIAVGFLGYLKYGEAVGGSITLNLPVDEFLATLVNIMMSLAIFLSYALQFYVPVDLLTPYIQRRVSTQNHRKADYILRLSLVMLSFSLAVAIPKFDMFISLVRAATILGVDRYVFTNYL